jgi:hypothetical protein
MVFTQGNLLILRLRKMCKLISIIILLFVANLVFSQKKIDVLLFDSIQNVIELRNYKVIKKQNIRTVKKLKKTRVFYFADFFCNTSRNLISYDELPQKLCIKYYVLASTDNSFKDSKIFLHCFIYDNEKYFFDKCIDISNHSDCFKFFKSKSKFYYVGRVKQFQNSAVFMER